MVTDLQGLLVSLPASIPFPGTEPSQELSECAEQMADL